MNYKLEKKIRLKIVARDFAIFYTVIFAPFLVIMGFKSITMTLKFFMIYLVPLYLLTVFARHWQLSRKGSE